MATLTYNSSVAANGDGLAQINYKSEPVSDVSAYFTSNLPKYSNISAVSMRVTAYTKNWLKQNKDIGTRLRMFFGNNDGDSGDECFYNQNNVVTGSAQTFTGNMTAYWKSQTTDAGAYNGSKSSIYARMNSDNSGYYWQYDRKYIVTYTAPTMAISGVSDSANGSVSGSATLTIAAKNTSYSTTLTATPNTGYHFSAWTDGNTDNPRTISVTENDLTSYASSRTYTARFAVNTYATSISASVVSLNNARTGTQYESAPVGVTTYVADTNGTQITNGSSIAHGTPVQFHAAPLYAQGGDTMVFSHFLWTVGENSGSIAANDAAIRYASDGTIYFDYTVGASGGAATSVTAVYERLYIAQVSSNVAATVRSNFDSASQSINNTWVSYSRTATQLAATQGIITLTVTNLNDYGIRANGNGSTIPNSCVLGSSSALTDRVTTWEVSPPNAGSVITFECYALHHTVTMIINAGDAFSRLTLTHNATNVTLAANQFTNSNGVYRKSWTVNDGDAIAYSENRDGGSRYALSTTITTTATVTQTSSGYVYTSTCNNLTDDMTIEIVTSVVQCTVTANQPEHGTTEVVPSIAERTGTVFISVTYEDALHLVQLTDVAGGSTYNLGSVLSGQPLTFTENGQTETISYSNDVLMITNIQRSHAFTFEVAYNWSEWLCLNTIGSYPATIQLSAYRNTPSNVLTSCVLPPNSDATIRRNIYDGYTLTVTPNSGYELLGCRMTLYMDTADQSEAIDEYEDTVFTTSVAELNALLATFLENMVANDGFSYTLQLEPVFRLNGMYMSYGAGHSGTQRPQMLWYISKDGHTKAPVKYVTLIDSTGHGKLLYGIADTENDADWTDDYIAYLNTL